LVRAIGEYEHSLARAGEFAGGHQPRGACADDDDVIWMWSAMLEHHRPVAA
jgi:hypothetical protein